MPTVPSFSPNRQLRKAKSVPSTGRETGFNENFKLAWDVISATELSISKQLNKGAVIDEMVEKYEKYSGEKLDFGFFDHSRYNPETEEFDINHRMSILGPKIQELLKSQPDLRNEFVFTEEEAEEEGDRRALALLEQEPGVTARQSTAGAVGQVLGSIAGYVKEPTMWATAPFGGPVGVGARGLGVFALREAGLGAVATGLSQPLVQDYKQDLGVKHGLRESAENIGYGALFGGAFGIVGGAGTQAVRGLIKSLKKDDLPPVSRRAIEEMDDELYHKHDAPVQGRKRDPTQDDLVLDDILDSPDDLVLDDVLDSPDDLLLDDEITLFEDTSFNEGIEFVLRDKKSLSKIEREITKDNPHLKKFIEDNPLLQKEQSIIDAKGKMSKLEIAKLVDETQQPFANIEKQIPIPYIAKRIGAENNDFSKMVPEYSDLFPDLDLENIKDMSYQWASLNGHLVAKNAIEKLQNLPRFSRRGASSLDDNYVNSLLEINDEISKVNLEMMELDNSISIHKKFQSQKRLKFESDLLKSRIKIAESTKENLKKNGSLSGYGQSPEFFDIHTNLWRSELKNLDKELNAMKSSKATDKNFLRNLQNKKNYLKKKAIFLYANSLRMTTHPKFRNLIEETGLEEEAGRDLLNESFPQRIEDEELVLTEYDELVDSQQNAELSETPYLNNKEEFKIEEAVGIPQIKKLKNGEEKMVNTPSSQLAREINEEQKFLDEFDACIDQYRGTPKPKVENQDG